MENRFHYSWIAHRIAIMKLALKDVMIYKFDFLVFSVTQPMLLIVNYFFWKAIFAYSGAATLRGFTFPEMVTYYVVTMIVSVLTHANMDDILSKKVYDGTLTGHLLKPFDYIWFWLSRRMGQRIYVLGMHVIPIVIVAVLLFPIKAGSPVNAVLFGLSVVLAMFITYFITLLFGMSSFWLKRYHGLKLIRQGVTEFMSGRIIPLTFMPLAFQSISSFLPFQYISFAPVLIFTGQYVVLQAVQVIGMQLLWIAVLAIVCQLVWRRALRQFAGIGT